MQTNSMSMLLLLPLVFVLTLIWSGNSAEEEEEDCQLLPTLLVLECTGIIMGISPSDNTLPLLITRVSASTLSKIQRLRIHHANVTHLNLDALSPFTSLTHLEVSYSRVRRVNGDFTWIQSQFKSLNLSHNHLPALEIHRLVPANTPLEELDLSFNILSNISLNTLRTLRLLALRDNIFTCRWVRTELYEWWIVDPVNRLLHEPNATYCAASEIAFDAIPFPVALSLKQRGMQECEATQCYCDVRGYFINKLPNPNFPNVYSSPGLNVTVALILDCGNMSLTELPAITPFATVLSVQHNSIRNLDRVITDANYSNIVGLDLSYNALDSLDFLAENRFMDDHFQFIILIGNQFHQIPEHIIAQVFKDTRKSLMRIKLGHNEIDCDCFTLTKLAPLLAKNQKVIDDWHNISCRTSVQKSLLDLKGEDVCSSSDDPRTDSTRLDFLWYALIAFESLLIISIVVKVWYDARQYRATGTLPTCSLYIPRLPCDFMLEGLKDSKHGSHGSHGHDHHHNGHGGSAGMMGSNRRRSQGHQDQQLHRDSAQSQKLLESHA